MNRAGIVAALVTEARAFTAKPLPHDAGLITHLNDGTLLAVSGVGYQAAASAARVLIEAGARGLVSFGLAGGLNPALHSGCLVMPEEVRASGRSAVGTDHAWRRRVVHALPPDLTVVSGVVWTSLTPLLTSDAKRALFADTGAAAVDMEAMAVALAAREAAVPFLAVKVIVDTAFDSLPPAALSVGPTGRIRSRELVSGLLRHPGEIIAIIRLARCYRPASRVLRSIAALHAVRQPAAEVIGR